MLPVIRDLYFGIQNLPPDQEVYIAARHLRAIGVATPKDKIWVTLDDETGDGEYREVECPDTRPVAITVRELRERLEEIEPPVEPGPAAVERPSLAPNISRYYPAAEAAGE